MPRGKESSFAKAERLQQESLRLRRRAMHDAIVVGLRRRPEFISKMYDQLASMYQGVGDKLVLADGSAPEPEAADSDTPKKWGILGDSVFKKELNENGEEAASSVAGSAAADEATASGAKTLADASVQQLTDVLAGIERVVFAPAALKGLKSKGQRAIPKSRLLELLEFVVDKDKTTRVNLSDAAAKVSFITQCHADNNANGRRGLNLPLPPSWVDDGFYRLLEFKEGGDVQVELKGSCIRTLPGHITQNIDVMKLYIDHNYSLKSAALKVHGGILDFSLQLLFAHAALVKRPSPTTPLASLKKSRHASPVRTAATLPASKAAALPTTSETGQPSTPPGASASPPPEKEEVDEFEFRLKAEPVG